MFQPNDDSETTDENSRLLTAEEAQHLLSVSDESGASFSWPGYDNMRRLAEAVNNRNLFVEFNDGIRYYISYNDRKRHVFVKPADSYKFQPCGYFNYDRLKAVLV